MLYTVLASVKTFLEKVLLISYSLDNANYIILRKRQQRNDHVYVVKKGPKNGSGQKTDSLKLCTSTYTLIILRKIAKMMIV